MTASGDPAVPSPDDPAGRARALQYDLALNGWELGGGSIRIHRRDLLERSLPAPGPLARGDAREVRGRPRRLRVRRAAARRDRPRHRPLGRAARPPDEHPRGHGLPEDPVGDATRCSRRRRCPEPGQYEELGLRFVGLPNRPRPERRTPDAAELGPLAAGSRSGRASRHSSARRASRSRGCSTCSRRSRRRPARSTAPSSACRCSCSWRSGSGGATVRCRARRSASRPSPGIFFTGDLMFWHHAIEAVGAGLATVLGNLQVIIVGFFAWLFLGERPSRATLLALPVVLARGRPDLGRRRRGRVRGGAAARGRSSASPRRSATPAYLLIIRWGGRDPRRPAGPVAVATVFVALCAFVVGEVGGDLDLTPAPASLFWLAMLGDHRAVGRLPADLDLAAAPAGDHHLDHPADPAGDVDGAGDGPARGDAVSGAVAGRRPGHRRDRRGDDPGGAAARRVESCEAVADRYLTRIRARGRPASAATSAPHSWVWPAGGSGGPS